MRPIITAMAISLGLAAASAAQPLNYPAAPKDPSVVDDYFGTKVPDIYRPLENDTAAATLAWVQAENAVTRGYLDAIPFRQAIKTRLTALNDYPKASRPWRGNDGRYYRSLNNGLQNQSAIWRRATLDAPEELFLDPNTLSDDGTVALTGLELSPDGRYTAYTISRSGSDWTEIYVIDTDTGELLPDHIEWAKFTGATWRGNDGFYYSAYPRPEAGKEYSSANQGHNIYYHRLGTPQADDILVYSDPEHPLHFHSVWLDDSERWLVLSTGGEGVGQALAVRDMQAGPDAPWVTIEATQDYPHTIIDIVADTLYVATPLQAGRFRVMKAPMANPGRDNWTELVPEDRGVLQGGFINGGRLYLQYEQDARSRVWVHDLATGARLSEIELPGIGTAGFSSNSRYPDIFYTFTSFTSPAAAYAYDAATGASTLLSRAELQGVDLDDYVTEQVFYTSRDGTQVPMFLTYKRGLKPDGTNPVYLYGYGGFNISLPPSFSANRLLWLENGGIYAQANLRGGSEYGEAWHEAGTKMHKLNVFDDFIGAAEHLIASGWTTPELLTIEGGSNGGLLVGACANLRPDLFKVAIPRVGVMDMMRYHLFTIGWNWASDYGRSDDSPSMAAYLLGYSPLHNIRNDGTPYPAILVTTADHDDRVVPAHSFKYAAALQAANTGDAPKLIRIDSKAGHGAGKPTAKVIDEWTDIYSFIFNILGRQPAQ